MITYTPYDLMELGEENGTETCLYCQHNIYLDGEDTVTELIHTKDGYYHAECAEAAAKWEFVAEYIREKELEQDFCEWYYGCEFKEFSTYAGDALIRDFERRCGWTDRNEYAFKYVEDNIEDYLEWYEENE